MASDGDGMEASFIPIMSEGGHPNEKIEIPDELPILPLRNMVIFPGVLIPISVGREKSLELVRQAYRRDKIVGAIAQRDFNVEDPKPEDLYNYGTIVQIVKILEMPDNTTTIIVQGKRRFVINNYIATEPYCTANISVIDEVLPDNNQLAEFEAITSSIRDLSSKIIQMTPGMPNEAVFALRNIENAFFLINFVCVNTAINTEAKQELLEESNVFNRSVRLLELLSQEMQKVQLKEDIQSKVRAELNKQQREFFLNQQIKTIQDELGGNPTEKEAKNLKDKAKQKKWSKEMADYFDKEIEKLQHLNAASGEYSIQLNYLQTLLDLPWGEYTDDNFDMNRAREILDSQHCGLEKVKERILEHLAVLKLKGNLKSPILCLYGPPGVGKTSLGRSIAEALGRKYVRMSLGGLHDEAEIRGEIAGTLGSARHIHVVLLLPGMVVHQVGEPVRAGIDRGHIHVLPVLDGFRGELPTVRGDAFHLLGMVVGRGILIGAGRLEEARDLLETGRGRQGNGRLAFLTATGGGQDDAVGAADTENGRGGSILEDGDVLDLIGVDLAERAFDAVNEHERFRAVERADTPDADDRVVTARDAGILHRLEAGELAGQGISQRSGRRFEEFLTRHVGDGAGQGHLALLSIADDHQLLECLGIQFQDHIEGG